MRLITSSRLRVIVSISKANTCESFLTGLDSRSFMTQLADVVSSGVTTLIWAGDAEYAHLYPCSVSKWSLTLLQLDMQLVRKP